MITTNFQEYVIRLIFVKMWPIYVLLLCALFGTSQSFEIKECSPTLPIAEGKIIVTIHHL